MEFLWIYPETLFNIFSSDLEEETKHTLIKSVNDNKQKGILKGRTAIQGNVHTMKKHHEIQQEQMQNPAPGTDYAPVML